MEIFSCLTHGSKVFNSNQLLYKIESRYVTFAAICNGPYNFLATDYKSFSIPNYHHFNTKQSMYVRFERFTK